jgi:diamine N-acetyltransferase
MKRWIDPVEGDSVRIRLLMEDDLMMTLAWRNQNHIRKWFIHSDVITPDQHYEWFHEYSERDNDFVFIIEEIKDLQKPIGQVSIYNIDWDEKSAEFGRLLIGEDDAIGRGLACAASKIILEIGQRHLGIAKYHLLVKKNNYAAIKLYKNLGFETLADNYDSVRMYLSV